MPRIRTRAGKGAPLTSADIVGPIHIAGRVVNAQVPTITNPPDDEAVTMDLTWNEHRYFGPMMAYRTQAGTRQLYAPAAMDINDVEPTGAVFINSQTLPAGEGNYTGPVEFSRPGSSRRGAAICAKQMTSTPQHIGLAFFTAAPGSVASDRVVEMMLLTHQGDLEFVIAGRGPIIQSPNETRYRLVVDNSGNLGTTAA